eukprot:515207-Alexandrium_andersonii.AAC.1
MRPGGVLPRLPPQADARLQQLLGQDVFSMDAGELMGYAMPELEDARQQQQARGSGNCRSCQRQQRAQCWQQWPARP